MRALYGERVLDHYRHPRNQRALETATASAEGHNPLCGDRVRIEVAVDEGTIRDAAFIANACVLCTAAASILTERVLGAHVTNALALSDADAIGWLDTRISPPREKCVTLPLHTLRQALEGAT